MNLIAFPSRFERTCRIQFRSPTSVASVERYRPIFLTVTTAFLGVAFYAAYRPIDDCTVCEPSTRRRGQIVVWIAAFMVAALVAFPYYVRFLF